MMRAFPRHIVNFSKDVFIEMVNRGISRQFLDGPHRNEFEKAFAAYHQVPFANATASGMGGVSLALKAMDIKVGDGVILSAYNYWKVPYLLKSHGLELHFVDACLETSNMDVSLIEEKINTKTKVILVTHTLGQPCDMEVIMRLAREYNLKVIEDCAQALGGEYQGQKVGTFADVSCFSFAMGKNIPCFGGGAVIAREERLGRRIKELSEKQVTLARRKQLSVIIKNVVGYIAMHPNVFPYFMFPFIRLLDRCNIRLSSHNENLSENVSSVFSLYNEKMTNAQAAVGVRQLKRIDDINRKLRKNALRYMSLLKDVSGIECPVAEKDRSKNTWLYFNILIKDRLQFRRKLLQRGVDTEGHHLSNCPNFKPFSSGQEEIYPVSAILVKQSVELPNNIFLTDNDIDYIADCVRRSV